MKKSDGERLKKIVLDWENLQSAIEQYGITKEMLLNNRFIQWAVTTPLYNIGEQVYQLSNTFKESHPEQPWQKIAALRHRIVHDYESVNWEMLTEIIYVHMPKFIEAVRELIEEMGGIS
ncbi:MAG: DUF86 domain-containing protein [Ruminococcus sp.]|nr:DUF86 domain-containing protein [Ruminococcus sp.]